MRRLALALAALCLAGPAFAQNVAPQVQQSSTMLNAANQVASTAAAVNATQAAGTVTITPPAGQFVYVTGLYVAACADGTVSVSSVQQNFTTTGFSGTLSIETSYISAATITSNPGAIQCDRVTLPFSVPLKSATAGTAITVVPPAQAAHMSFPIIVTYYTAP